MGDRDEALSDGLSDRDVGTGTRIGPAIACRLPEGVKVIPRRVADRLMRAQRLRDASRRDARRIVDAAQNEASSIREQAYRAGFAAGHSEGFAQFCAQTHQAITAMNDAEAERAAMVLVLEQALDAVLGPRGRDDEWGRTRFEQWVRHGLDAIHRRSARIRVCVHPIQAKGLQRLLSEWAAAFPGCEIEVVAADELLWDSYRIEGGTRDGEWWIADALPDALSALKATLRRPAG